MAGTLALHRLLQPKEPCTIVDVGANPLEDPPPYAGLLALGLCRVVGFEPLAEGLAALEAKKGPNETYFGHALGDGERHTLRLCRTPGMSSLLQPSKAAAQILAAFQQYGEVLGVEEVATRRLDDLAEVTAVDFLKIDAQGSELSILRNGATKLARAVVVQTEVAFFPLYEDQPLFADVDAEMRRLGFMPHTFFPGIKKWSIAPMIVDGDPTRGLNQMLDGDLVYVRDLFAMDRFDDEQLKQMALVVHACYGSFDLALRCIDLLETRGTLGRGAKVRYMQILQMKGDG